ncbi:MAG: metallophosphoesterase [Defluviitaleaceae bacterium]|nr:metallophosphoesterase [Defluviitaleaceae bacterium]
MSESILVLSDSHGGKGEVERVVGLYARAVSAIVHLGDLAADIADLPRRWPETPFYIVAGNCDRGLVGDMPESLEFSLGGKKIILAHGHRFGVEPGGEGRIHWWALEREADVCLFGHTHVPEMFMDGKCLMFNPGSLTRPRAGRPSYGIISINRAGVTGRHLIAGGLFTALMASPKNGKPQSDAPSRPPA